MAKNTKAEPQQPQLQIHKMYLKDTSFTVNDPEKLFLNKWEPELNVDLNITHNALSEANTHEVVLKIKCDVKNEGNNAFELEVAQAGIFEISGIEGEPLEAALRAHCPNLLYPYAREAVSDIVTRGGFPQLALAPVNFDMLYAQQQATKH